ncbi:MAG: tetratricopeptide repeat protein [Candidatus Omnitrophica bacterium]|nr:tetratricopeptide repeat protein [Candidatus Omnitrophota bacterium]MCF7893859.1 tetratricopeptide repeat protein [Candidatus Omnitrophota bacterium]
MTNKKTISIYLLSLSFILYFLSFPAYPASLEDAQRQYLFGNLDKAVRLAKRLRSSAQNIYFLGLVYIKKKEYRKARYYFKKIIDNYQNSYFYQKSQIKLADSYFFEGSYQKANQLFTNILNKKNQKNDEPLILLRLAQVAAKQGKWADKEKYSTVLKNRYPNSLEIKYIKILDSYGSFFTVQIGAFSDKSNALNLYNQISKDFDDHVFIVEKKNQDFPIYKVRVGKFKDRYSVEKLAEKLQNQGYPTRIYP